VREGARPDRHTVDDNVPPSLGKVFISYRWDDVEAEANLLYLELVRALGSDFVHLDRGQGRVLGGNFPARLDAALRASSAMLVLIGPEWNPIIGSAGVRRLDSAKDVVRHEIRTGLLSEMHMIPVLLRGASMPRDTDLPDDIRGLCMCDAAEIRRFGFAGDIELIIDALRPHVGSVDGV
jgi:hypothetical protein